MPFDEERDIAQTAHLQRLEQDRDDLNKEIAGQNGNRASRFLTNVSSDGDTKDEKRKKAVQTDRDAFYLALMSDGAFGGFIVDEVFGGKSDADIADIVAEIEAKSGLSFTDYATNILGPEAAQRNPNESDADYRRRIVMALAEEMIDPVTGEIKAQYADDPLADIILRDAAYQRIMGQVAHLNSGVPDIEIQNAAADLKQAGYANTKHAATHVRDDAAVGELRDGQGGQAAKAADVEQNFLKGQKFFDSSLGGPSR